MTPREFEQLVLAGYEKIPAHFRKKMRNVALLIADEPSLETREREGLGPDETLFGYYHGVPLAVRGEGYGHGDTLPDTITIYRRPIEEAAAGDPEEIKRIVADTVWHEFAHHFGLDEDAVRKAEARRERR